MECVEAAGREHAVGCYIHAKDGCTATDIKDHLVLEDVLAVVYRIAVGLCSDFIFLYIGQSYALQMLLIEV